MEIFSQKEFNFKQSEYFELCNQNIIEEDKIAYDNPKLGEIWICKIPVLVVGEEVFFKTMKRPILVIDDTHENFIKNDTKNYYGLKITSQKDSYQRIKIKNLTNTGLYKESFIRIELPLKVEKEQFLYRIGVYDKEKVEKIKNRILKKLKENTLIKESLNE